VTWNTTKRNSYGIYVSGGSGLPGDNNEIKDNVSNSNTNYGIYLSGLASNNTVTNNTTNLNLSGGIYDGGTGNTGTGGAPNSTWYVNDTSATGDVYTSGMGSNSNAGTAESPLRTLGYVLTYAKAGDTVYVDAGTYNEAVTIGVDTLTLIGAGGGKTVLDKGGDSTVNGNGIYASSMKGLTIRKLRVRNFNYGIKLYIVTQSRVDECEVVENNTYGIHLTNSSTDNTVSATRADTNYYGIYMDLSSTGNTLSGDTANGNRADGIYVGTNNNVLTRNTANGNVGYGIYLDLLSFAKYSDIKTARNV